MLSWMNGQIDNQLFREWILSASSKCNPACRLEEMILLPQHVRCPYRERHGGSLRNSVRRYFLWNVRRIGMCASMYRSGCMGGVFAWENHGVPLFLLLWKGVLPWLACPNPVVRWHPHDLFTFSWSIAVESHPYSHPKKSFVFYFCPDWKNHEDRIRWFFVWRHLIACQVQSC